MLAAVVWLVAGLASGSAALMEISLAEEMASSSAAWRVFDWAGKRVVKLVVELDVLMAYEWAACWDDQSAANLAIEKAFDLEQWKGKHWAETTARE